MQNILCLAAPEGPVLQRDFGQHDHHVVWRSHGSDNALKQEVATMGNAQLLQKPAQEQTLLAALAGVLRWRR